jgi:pre-mRNA-splicing factor SYF1
MCNMYMFLTRYWNAWKEFEVAHGNEDTFKEMLRIKRTVQATYNTTVNYNAAILAQGAAKEQLERQRQRDAMAKLEDQAKEQMSRLELARKQAAASGDAAAAAAAGAGAGGGGANPDEIDLGDDDDDDDGSGSDGSDSDGSAPIGDVAQRKVPDSVYGELAAVAERERTEKRDRGADDQQMGALERLKRLKKQ